MAEQTKEFGVTENGFSLKRMQDIRDEIEAEQSEGFGFDVSQIDEQSFLNVLNTTFENQLAMLWEMAQDVYNAMYPSSATGVNLDNAVQFGGVTRQPKAQSIYSIHCTGSDGTVLPADTRIKTSTKPEVELYLPNDSEIGRHKANEITIKPVTVESGTYTVTINEKSFSYVNLGGDATSILTDLKSKIDGDEFSATVENTDNGPELVIRDVDAEQNNVFDLTDNLTTTSVTSIVVFNTVDYGRISLSKGAVDSIVTGVSGFNGVTNKLDGLLGRDTETDSELRKSYAQKSMLRSNTMLDSVIAELLNNVTGVVSASGFENDRDTTDSNGLTPHSIEIVVEGGDNSAIAAAILRRKAAGIQTNGSIEVGVPGLYGDIIPIRFNRPEKLITWIRIRVQGTDLPSDYADTVKKSVVDDTQGLKAGENLYIQKLIQGIYTNVIGITYVEIKTAVSDGKPPAEGDYAEQNVEATNRQIITTSKSRVEVIR